MSCCVDEGGISTYHRPTDAEQTSFLAREFGHTVLQLVRSCILLLSQVVSGSARNQRGRRAAHSVNIVASTRLLHQIKHLIRRHRDRVTIHRSSGVSRASMELPALHHPVGDTLPTISSPPPACWTGPPRSSSSTRLARSCTHVLKSRLMARAFAALAAAAEPIAWCPFA